MLAEKLTDEQCDQYEQEIYESKTESSLVWPTIDNIAFQGLAGEIIDPQTESDSITILGYVLCMFGNIIGRSAHFQVEANKHYTNENAIFIGDTAKGRKGTGEAIVNELFTFNKPNLQYWKANRIKSGLSSGEGIIYHVRNGTENDEGVKDKRLYIREPEFGGVLRMLQRDGNKLSALIREAWDSGDLSSLTKNSPLTASGAHISIIGHITAQELNRYLHQTEIFNGLANRFLWFCVKRSKFLPEGGNFYQMDTTYLTEKIEEAIEFVGTVKEVRRDEAARKIWIAVYPKLSEGKHGMAGAVLSRAEAHVMRLALLYALLDSSSLIKADHLCAALALWKYIEASVIYLFGDRIGDAVAERIHDAVADSVNGLTRTDISSLFNRHGKRGHIDDAIKTLIRCGKVEIVKMETAGRPIEKVILKNVHEKKANQAN